MKRLRIDAWLAVCTTVFAGPASAAEVNLKFAHFYPPVNHHTGEMVPAWAKRIAEQSKGRIEITQYPSGQLLKAPETFDGLRNGVADIGMVVPGLTPGRFPEISLADLPFTFRTATGASRAMMER